MGEKTRTSNNSFAALIEKILAVILFFLELNFFSGKNILPEQLKSLKL